jgi:hypothetical protein
MPERIEETLLVVAGFKHDGVEYRVGDRVPVRHRAIRRIAAKSPEFFRMEYAPENLDLQWLAAVELEAEEQYEAQKRLIEEQKAAQKRAVRHELEAQDLPQPELERRFKKQQEEEEKLKQKVREERERDAVEHNVLLGERYSGFNYWRRNSGWQLRRARK